MATDNHPGSYGCNYQILAIYIILSQALVPHIHQQRLLLYAIPFRTVKITHPCCCHILLPVPRTLICLPLFRPFFVDLVIRTTFPPTMVAAHTLGNLQDTFQALC